MAGRARPGALHGRQQPRGRAGRRTPEPVPADPERVRLFRDFDPVEAGGDVPDPYYGGEQGFEEVLGMVERTCAVLVAGLQRVPGLRP
ncbi:arsenate reductase/protein-tyrosine-phosphatase family protein [Nocardioides anomalus]|uniref:arsenate reductase/protein-tyrosine-phosphatase family protein n=1 Tax=Nocardioides anomalus TaxID=2712223 RepID=UPI002E7A1897|nr:hypothetical protein [Nocardioides anomalus]